MFKKILQSLSKSQSAKAAPIVAPAKNPLIPVMPARPSGVLDQIAKGPAAAEAPATPAAPVVLTPEQLCEIAPKTPKDQVSARLRLLYRRYNRSASSLDATTRAEADKMLEAIVLVREKYFGEI